jgi:hypothetical protein
MKLPLMIEKKDDNREGVGEGVRRVPNEMFTMGVIIEGPYFIRQPAPLELTGHVNMTAGSAALAVIPTCRILGIPK